MTRIAAPEESTSLSPLQRSEASDLQPVLLFILSPSFSGSTLLTFLLAAHLDIATIGELKATALGNISKYHCSCGELLQKCPFWAELQSKMDERGRTLSFENFGTHFNHGPWLFRRLIRSGVRNWMLALPSKWALNLVPAYRRRRREILAKNRAMIELIALKQKAGVFLDGSKDADRVQQFIESGEWKIRIVRLIRDGRGVANSYMKHHQVDMETAARDLARTERANDRVMAMLPKEQTLLIKYEDLCAQPDTTVESVLRLTGCAPTPSVDAPPRSEFHILGNSMRLNKGKQVKVDEKWRVELSAGDLKTFAAVAGNRNAKHGYES